MARKRITKRAVEALRAKTGRAFLWDTEVPGFGVIAEPPSVRRANGRRIYVLRYLRDGRDRRMVLGVHGELTPDQARQLAAQRRAEVRAGRDPLDERLDRRQAATLREVVEIYRERHLPKRKPGTVREYTRILDQDIVPRFGRRPADEIRPADVAHWHASMSDRPYQANRCLALLRSLLEHAARWGFRDPAKPNPAAYVERFRESSRERYLSDEELGRFGAALSAIETAEKRRRVPAAALRLLILTGARKNEVLRLRWEDLDRKHGVAWLPDSKTGKRPLHLSGPAWEVLDGLRRSRKATPVRGWCFPSQRKRDVPLEDLRRTFAAVCKRAKISGLRIHDLRHSNAAAGAGVGLSLPLIGKLLGHKRASTTERYAHLADDPVRAAAERVQSRVAEGLARRQSRDLVVETGNG